MVAELHSMQIVIRFILIFSIVDKSAYARSHPEITVINFCGFVCQVSVDKTIAEECRICFCNCLKKHKFKSNKLVEFTCYDHKDLGRGILHDFTTPTTTTTQPIVLRNFSLTSSTNYATTISETTISSTVSVINETTTELSLERMLHLSTDSTIETNIDNSNDTNDEEVDESGEEEKEESSEDDDKDSTEEEGTEEDSEESSEDDTESDENESEKTEESEDSSETEEPKNSTETEKPEETSTKETSETEKSKTEAISKLKTESPINEFVNTTLENDDEMTNTNANNDNDEGMETEETPETEEFSESETKTKTIPIIKTDSPMSGFKKTTIEDNDEMVENNTIAEKESDMDEIPAHEYEFDGNEGNSTETEVNHDDNNDAMLETEENSDENSGNSTETNDDSEESNAELSSVSVLNTELITNEQNTTEAIGTIIADNSTSC